MPKGIDLLPAVLPDKRTEEAPDSAADSGSPELDKPFIVVLYNCDCHTFEQVEVQLQKATGCSLEKAEALAMEVHLTGRSIVFSGEAEKCERVAAVLRSIKLQVETDRA